MDIKIKEIKSSDIEGFANEQWEIVNERYNLLPLKEIFFFGVYSHNKLIGYTKVEIRGGVVEIRDLLIKDKLTGKGIGQTLLSYIENWAKDRKCRKAIIKVPSVYKKTVRFYKKNEYKKDATLSNYYYGCDWYYMGKEL